MWDDILDRIHIANRHTGSTDVSGEMCYRLYGSKDGKSCCCNTVHCRTDTIKYKHARSGLLRAAEALM